MSKTSAYEIVILLELSQNEIFHYLAKNVA